MCGILWKYYNGFNRYYSFDVMLKAQNSNLLKTLWIETIFYFHNVEGYINNVDYVKFDEIVNVTIE